MNRSESRWTVADEWFAEFLERLSVDARRCRRLQRERVVVPVQVELARAFEDKTEQLRRMVAVERERWLAEQRRTA